MFQLAMIGLYPFWFATGLFPRSILAVYPKASLLYAHLAYWGFGMWQWNSDDNVKVFVGLAINWLLVLWWCDRRWQVAILLAWAATSVIAIVFGLHSNFWDWTLFAVIALRSFVDFKRT